MPAERSELPSRRAGTEMREHLVGVDRVSRVVLRDAFSERRVEGPALLVIELIERVSSNRDQLHDGPFRQFGGLIRTRRPFRTMAFSESIGGG